MAVTVACARKQKFAAVNDVERYELNVLFSADPVSRERKYGVAVIITESFNTLVYSDIKQRWRPQYRSRARVQHIPTRNGSNVFDYRRARHVLAQVDNLHLHQRLVWVTKLLEPEE